MTKTACQYKIVRFAPFAETEEFANIGVVLFEPKTGQLHFQLAKKRFGRVNHFFELEDNTVYSGAINGLQRELERLQRDLPYMSNNEGKTLAKEVFADFTRFQSGLIHFSNTRVIRAGHLKGTVQRLFQHYVSRSFHTPQYRENVLVRKLRDTFKRYDLTRIYREGNVNTGLITVRMPFTHFEQGQLRGAIKPLAFDQKDAQKQVEHMDQWMTRIRHLLDEANVSPEALMLAFDEDSTSNKDVQQYIRKCREKLERDRIQTTLVGNTEALVEFARERA